MTAVASDGRWQAVMKDERGGTESWFEVSLSGVELENHQQAVVALTRDVTRKKRDEKGRLERDAAGQLTHGEEIFVEPDLDLEDLCGGTPPEEPAGKAA